MRTGLRVLGLLAAGWIGGGCGWVLGLEELGVGAPDAALPSGPDSGPSFAVRGLAYGLLAPLDLRLEHDRGVDVLALSEDGPFAFEAELAPGDAYAVTIEGTSACVLDASAGTIADADVTLTVSCEGVFLTELLLSAPTPRDLGFDPAQSDYGADVPLLQRSATITATTALPGATLRIDGVAVASGVSSPDIPLQPGDNAIEVAVTNPGGGTRVYQVIARRGPGLTQVVYGKGANTAQGDQLGISVAIDGDTLVVGANSEDGGAQDSGAVYVFRRVGASWAQEAYLKASNRAASDYFGTSVAVSGDTLAVGAPGEDSADVGNPNDDAATGSGAVYVFRRSGASWAQEAYLKASNVGADDQFGFSVSLSGDTLAVGATGEDSATQGVNGGQDDDSAEDSGAVYVFRRSGTSWGQEAYVKASNTGADDEFGISLDVDGDRLAVGAYFEDSVGVDGNDDIATDSGAAYVFRRSGASWAQEAYLKASNVGSFDQFGTSVALSGDTLAVSALGEDSAATGVDGDQGNDDATTNSGAAYVFRRSGTSWAQEAYLKASNPGQDDRFGFTVALDGDVLAVSAYNEDSAATGIDGDATNNASSNSGAVYVFGRGDAGWVHQAYVKASNPGPDDRFGRSLAVAGDTLAVGSWGEDSAATGINGNQQDNTASSAGAVYVFH
ncbi:cadherin-like beta sandwich domain-containing protein [Haliangium sp.]|uniref:cadherin-like beta sandwich domain-containing protein n=1 Tax=Haliangium sp. TaxID=2663208 RepID=UPI003D138C72